MTCVVLAFISGGASAETGGHFLAGAEEITVKGTENTTHSTQLSIPGLTAITCEEDSYEANPSKSASKTWTEVKATPKYGKCKTKGSSAVTIDQNGCTYVLKIGKKAIQDNTVDIQCGEGKAIIITHPECEITIPAQSGRVGVAYTSTVESGVSTLTLDLTVKEITTQFHKGICTLLGTPHTGELTGSVTASATAAGTPTSIRAVGSEELQFRSELGHWSITGKSTGATTFTFGELLGSVSCASGSFDGTADTEETPEITVKPAYGECEGVKSRVVTPHMNGCAYLLTLTGEGGDGRVDLECPAGVSIETTVDKFPEGCTITIGTQTASGVVDYKEEGAGTGRKLVLTWTVEGIKYKRDGCEVGGEGNNGTIAGAATLEGEDTSGNPKGIWIE